MYQCLAKSDFADSEGYRIIPIREEDGELIRLWRNAQMHVLRQIKLVSASEQQLYFQQVILPSFAHPQPKQILFSFFLKETLIGYGGVTNLDWVALRAEVSFLVDPCRIENRAGYASDFTHYLNLLCQAAFKELQLHRLFTETFAFRKEHIAILENFGFIKEGALREHVFKRNQWVDSIMHGLLAEEWSDTQ